MKNIVKTNYTIGIDGIRARIAVVADLHNNRFSTLIPLLRDASPDIIALPGDICGSLCESGRAGGNLTKNYIREAKNNSVGLELLRQAAKIAPTFYSIGNHECGLTVNSRAAIAETGAVLLESSCVSVGGLLVGGVSSGGAHGLWHKSDPPDIEWIERFSSLEGKKVLLCHHPEYWERHIIGKNIDLTLSGHAHGGQWRAFGRGFFAPGQGFFPKYTSGVHKCGEQYLAVSRGLKLGAAAPRINNPPELLIIDIIDTDRYTEVNNG